MYRKQRKQEPTQWVLAYEKNGFLVDYLRHPEFIFDNPNLAYERKADAAILLAKTYPTITTKNIFVAPLRDFF